MLEAGHRRLGRFGAAGSALAAQLAQAHALAQAGHERCGQTARLGRAGLQDVFKLAGVAHESQVAFAHGRDFAVNALKQHLFGVTPGNAVGKGLAQGGGFRLAGKGLVNLKQRRAFAAFGFTRCARVGDDAGDLFAQMLTWRKQRNRVVVAFAHLAAVQPGKRGHRGFDQRFGQHQLLPIQVVKALGNVARHFNVLDLVAPDRHLVRLEHQNIRRHQHRVHEEAGRDVGVRLVACCVIFVHRSFVSVRAVEHAFAGHASQQPGQLGDFRNVRLAVKGHALRVQTGGQPGGGNLQRGLLDAFGLAHFDQRVVVGQKVKALHAGRQAGTHCRAHCAHVVAQMGCARSGDAGQYAQFAHGCSGE